MRICSNLSTSRLDFYGSSFRSVEKRLHFASIYCILLLPERQNGLLGNQCNNNNLDINRHRRSNHNT